MKTKLLLIVLFLIFLKDLTAQENTLIKDSVRGSFITKVFFNYHYNSNAETKSLFEINRAYLGYKYQFNNKFSSKVVADFGKNTSGSAYTAFLKTAQLDWKLTNSIKLSAGMIGLKQMNEQDKFFGYRYIEKTFSDKYGMGTTSDLGLNVEIKLNKIIKFNVFALNGDGYKNMQDTLGVHKLGYSVILNPVKNLTLKFYQDYMQGDYKIENDDKIILTENIITNNFLGFIGYNFNDKFRIGIEYNYLQNATSYNSPKKHHNLFGYSIFGAIPIKDKFELFSRYDCINSNILENEVSPWYYDKAGQYIITGLQFAPTKKVMLALNIRNQLYDDKSISPNHSIYLNFNFYI